VAVSAILRAEVSACMSNERRQALNTTLALATVELHSSLDDEDQDFNWLVAAALKDADALHSRGSGRRDPFCNYRRWYNEKGRCHSEAIRSAGS